MKEYLIIEHQDRGYSGCGIKIKIINANSIDEAIEVYLNRRFEEEYDKDEKYFNKLFNGDGVPDNFEIYEVNGHMDSITCMDKYQKRVQEYQKEMQKQVEKRRIEYEKQLLQQLKEKYE